MNASFDTEILDAALARRRQHQELERQSVLSQVIRGLESVGEQYGIQQAYLFGSLTRPGHFHDASDVDLALPGPLPEDCCSFISTLSAMVGREVDLVTLDRCHFAHRIHQMGILWTKMP